MPNLRQQLIGALGALAPSQQAGDDVGIYLRGSSGASVTVTKRQIQQQFQAATGTTAAKKATVIAWIKTQITTGLGPAHVAASAITVDFNTADGTPVTLEIVS